MTLEVTRAELAILDGSWQERPDTLATFDAGPTRGTLYVSVEVIGDVSVRDPLARQMIATAQGEYARSRGSLMQGLTEAVRAVNRFLYQHNQETPRDAHCNAGITAVALRERDAFVAQGGPGLVVHARGTQLTRYPPTSPWFLPEEPPGNFPTPGAVPIGLRHDCTPDLSYIKIEPGDALILGTRALAHLITEDELADAVIGKPVDSITEDLEDLAGSADLAVIALRIAGEPPGMTETAAAETPEPQPSRMQLLLGQLRRRGLEEETAEMPLGSEQEEKTDLAQANEARMETRAIEIEEPELEPILDEELAIDEETLPPAPTPEELESIRLREEQRLARNARIKEGILGAGSLATRGIKGIGSRVDTRQIRTWIHRGLGAILGLVARLIHTLTPGGQDSDRSWVGKEARPAWKIAALIFPLIILGIGGGSWYQYQRGEERKQTIEFHQLIEKTKNTIQQALAQSDKNSARALAQDALKLAEDARKLRPADLDARSISLQAQDALDTINGVSFLLYVPAFASYTDKGAKPGRIALNLPDLYILDRGLNRIYQYTIDDVGSTVNTVKAVNADGSILRSGDRAGDRSLGELIDMVWIDAGRLAAIDRSGAFWQYAPASTAWSARLANDGNKWSRVSLAGSYSNNLYLLDPGTNQILKYVPVSDSWSAYVTYFAPGVTTNLAAAVDMGVDTDVWVLRKDGGVYRFSGGRPIEFSLRDLEIPLKDPVAISVASPGASIYIADAGNQRIVQFDRNTGRYLKQFKAGGTYRDAFNALKTLAVDEAKKKIFVVNGTQVLFSNLP